MHADRMEVHFHDKEQLKIPAEDICEILIKSVSSWFRADNREKEKEVKLETFQMAKHLELTIVDKRKYDRLKGKKDIEAIHFLYRDEWVHSFEVEWTNEKATIENKGQKTICKNNEITVSIHPIQHLQNIVLIKK